MTGLLIGTNRKIRCAWDETIVETTRERVVVYTTDDGQKLYTIDELNAYEAKGAECLKAITKPEDIENCYTGYSVDTVDLTVETTRVVHHDAEYDTIYHEAEGHYEMRTVWAAYDEEVFLNFFLNTYLAIDFVW